MQKLMLMRLCNTSEHRHSVSDSQGLPLRVLNRDEGSGFERSWSRCPTLPRDPPSRPCSQPAYRITKSGGASPGRNILFQSLDTAGTGRLGVGIVQKGWVEEGTKPGACHLKIRRALSQNDDGWTDRLLVIRNRWTV